MKIDEETTISKMFGINTFDYSIMKENLPLDAYNRLKEYTNGNELNEDLAAVVAHALKEWAIKRGATHFTHVFQPLVRPSAEKHDTFLTNESFNNGVKPVEKFSASQLVQAEPDASSMPSGGMRSTFEARGYAAWDPTSPAYLMERVGGVTLCIPSIYISFNGDALDKKTPLLRSVTVLDNSVRRLLKLFDKPVKKIIPTCGPEQEFFLISKEYVDKRPDLLLTGRTLFGNPSPKGQKLEDHYFGSLSDKVLKFFKELEFEAYKVGIPLKTRHNEVAPKQLEIVPIYEDVNIACDHNALLMELMDKVAKEQNLVVLFHEKPFHNINGSGKHLNWSLMTDQGRNLFDPGTTDEEHLEFLLFLISVVNAVYQRGYLLRSSVATPGNDFRLGGNEAPPAIISVYLGEIITSILEKISKGEKVSDFNSNGSIDLGLLQLPKIRKDNTDRNRTSPFAFTGQKFEFRAVGASQSLNFPSAFLNIIVAAAIDETYDVLKSELDKGLSIRESILNSIKIVYQKCSKIIFNGNNYSEKWADEAKLRGLSNYPNAFEALKIPLKDEYKTFIENSGILSKNELIGRYNALLNRFIHRVEIEAMVLLELSRKEIIPAFLMYLNKINNVTVVLTPERIKGSIYEQYGEIWTELNEKIVKIENRITKLHEIEKEIEKAAEFATYQVQPAMNDLRTVINQVELLVPSDIWPYPTYNDILHRD